MAINIEDDNKSAPELAEESAEEEGKNEEGENKEEEENLALDPKTTPPQESPLGPRSIGQKYRTRTPKLLRPELKNKYALNGQGISHKGSQQTNYI